MALLSARARLYLLFLCLNVNYRLRIMQSDNPYLATQAVVRGTSRELGQVIVHLRVKSMILEVQLEQKQIEGEPSRIPEKIYKVWSLPWDEIASIKFIPEHYTRVVIFLREPLSRIDNRQKIEFSLRDYHEWRVFYPLLDKVGFIKCYEEYSYKSFSRVETRAQRPLPTTPPPTVVVMHYLSSLVSRCIVKMAICK